MKVLFDDASSSPLKLTRTEVVAFINSLRIFSKSLEIEFNFRQRARANERVLASSGLVGAQEEEQETANEEEVEGEVEKREADGSPGEFFDSTTALLIFLGGAAFLHLQRRSERE